jgi:hypothetical protein
MVMTKLARTGGFWWSRFHFLIRFLGITGLVVAIVAFTVGWREKVISGWSMPQSYTDARDALQRTWEEATLPLGNSAWDTAKITAVALLAGSGTVLFALLVELFAAVPALTGRRSAVGSNALIQIGLATALLIAINYYAFDHYARIDWSHDADGKQQFTLDPKIAGQLRTLKGKTLIVVDLRENLGHQQKQGSDAIDNAAKNHVLDKVKDLVEQFREFGTQFRVEVLDVKKDEFEDQFEKLTKNRPVLREALNTAPENSIYFCAPGDDPREGEAADNERVQRLSFNDFYQLDKTASKVDKNLVMFHQGVGPFAQKVLNVQAKRPLIGIAVTHEWLTTEGLDEYSLRGLKKSLMARGFDVRDILLKRWSRFTGPETGVYTPAESNLERLEERLTIADALIKGQEAERKDTEELIKKWRTATLDQLSKDYAKRLRGAKITEEVRQINLAQLTEDIEDIDAALAENRKRREAARGERASLNTDELAEQRRFSDTRGKLSKLLADCDLLIVPRMTIRNVNIAEETVPMRVHRIEDDGQIDAIKDFMKSGKPILACFGPINEPSGRFAPPDSSGPDKLEDLLTQLGFHFGKQTVLFDSESESFAENRVNMLATGANVQVPPLEFEWKPGAGLPSSYRTAAAKREPNLLSRSLAVTAHSMGKDEEGKNWQFDLRIRHARPIYFEPNGSKQTRDPYFLMTSAASWNDEQPFPTRERTPHFERGKNESDKGTLDEVRRGPFPIGAAAETTLPASWYDGKTTPATVRLAAIGQGGFFSGMEVKPAQETLVVDTINWLLRRDDSLPNDEHKWSYPRVELSEQDKVLWIVGTWALPLLFAYVGLMVWLVRRVR